MVDFYTNIDCTELLQVLKFDESYVEDLYGGILDNVVEVGTAVAKTIYAKNNDADMVLIKGIEIDSPFITAVPEKVKLGLNEITPIIVVLKPTLEGIQFVEAIADPAEKQIAKEKLLRGNIRLKLYRITMP
jgi:hypothetical protein